MSFGPPHWPRRRRFMRATAAVGAAVLSATALVAVANSPAAAASTCSVNYQIVSSWNVGFSVNVTITNSGSAISSWNVGWNFHGSEQVTDLWNGSYTQSGKAVSVTNESYNGSIASGGTASFGFNGSDSGSTSVPTSFTLNGQTCGGGGGTSSSPSTGPTSASPSTGPTSSSPSTGPTSSSPSASASASTSPGGGSCGSGESLLVDPTSFTVHQGKTETFGVALSSSPSAAVPITVTQTSGNTGLTVSSGATTNLDSTNWNLPQPVVIAANSSGTGATVFTVSAPGCASVTVTGTEVTQSGSAGTHVVNPFSGASWYVNPNYTAEADSSAASASGTLAAQMETVGNQGTYIWLDRIGAIYGGSDDTTAIGGAGRASLQTQLQNAVAGSSGPVLFPIVIYDLPDRDCAALASNGELSIANNGLNYYEHAYIDPIASILSDYQNTNLRIVTVIEPDSLPNLVTNTSMANCAQAQSSGVYTSGIEYALNKLHAISNVYNYVDIAHSAWLGWSSNMTPAVQLYASVAKATTAGFASVDGFISDTANTIPVSEPYMTATENVDGNAVDTVQYYSYDPYIDELDYDEAMYSNLVGAGFSSNIGMLIDTGRDGWGDPATRPTGPCSTSTCTTTTQFVNESKIDARPFRGDWCNPEDAGIGALPQANPVSSFSHLYAYVWVKPPGESDGTYPAFSGKGDPHCDPNGTQTDGSGNSYPTDAIPDSPPAGTWFPVQFNQLVSFADPAIP